MIRVVFGCGYLGHRVARLWQATGDEVTVATRSEARAKQFAEEAFGTLVADVTRPESLEPVACLERIDTLLFAVGYDRTAEPSIHQVYADGFRQVLSRLPSDTRRVIYISTTGVYGNAEGDWVDEQTTPDPQREGGLASLAAEQALQQSSFADRATVLRLAGIYGPGRIPLLKQLKAGEPIAAPSGGWLNLIHVDDAARVVTLVADSENGSQLFCVSDGSPVIRSDYYAEVAARIHAPQPTFVAPPADSPRAARARSDKRICNRRLMSELAPRLQFPSYREGLSSILGTGRANG